MTKGLPLKQVNGNGLTIGIVKTRWNEKIIEALLNGCKSELEKAGVAHIEMLEVAGSFELPYGAKMMIKNKKVDAVICIGCLIKGDTMHFEYIADATAKGIMTVQIEMGVPCIFGVLTCLTEEQAEKRAGLTADGHNHGIDWGITAVEMATLYR